MSKVRYVMLEKITGDLKAEMLRGLLQAQGIPAILTKEGYARALGLNIGPLGEVEILVPEGQLALARQVLADYYAGVFAREEFLTDSTGYDDGEENTRENDWDTNDLGDSEGSEVTPDE